MREGTLGAEMSSGTPSFSFELFPPKTDDGERALWDTVRALEALHPTFVSVTYGAGGSTQDRTVRITGQIARETDLRPVGHLTCVGAGRSEIRDVVQQYADEGVRTILALRGDPPTGIGSAWTPHPDGFRNAIDLVELIASMGDFSVGVAAFPEGHPESPSREHDAKVLRAKQDAGADFAITQLFFRVEDYLSLRDLAAAAGCNLPIIPGIMPVTNVAQIEKFTATIGASLPAELAERFRAVQDDAEAVTALGVDVATQMCARLLDEGAPGLHFYTLNRSTSTMAVYEALGLRDVVAR